MKNLSFKIEQHQKVAFCGRTGCGKTSILNCLFRLYEIDKGDIFFMGEKLDHLSLFDLRAKIVIYNNFFLFFKRNLVNFIFIKKILRFYKKLS